MSTSETLGKIEYFDAIAAEKCFGNYVTGKAQDKLGMLNLEKRIVKGTQCIERPFLYKKVLITETNFKLVQ